jgi:uncharacterized protein (TIGR03083 family)
MRWRVWRGVARVSSVTPMSEPLIDRLQEVWADIGAACADLTAEQWQRPTDCPGWSVKDQVAHMIGTEMMLLGEDPPLAEIGHAPHVRNDVGKFNEQWVVLYRNRTGSDTLADFRRVTGRRLDALRALPAEKWDEEGFTPEGPGPYRQFMAIRVFDCWYHDQDIREALDRPGFLEGEVADLALGRIPTKALPYVVGKKASAPQGATVVFDVTGRPPIEAAVGVDGRAALLAAVPADPTTRLTLDRRTFARLAGGRWTGETARAAGQVQVEGDDALGQRIVDNLAFTL